MKHLFQVILILFFFSCKKEEIGDVKNSLSNRKGIASIIITEDHINGQLPEDTLNEGYHFYNSNLEKIVQSNNNINQYLTTNNIILSNPRTLVYAYRPKNNELNIEYLKYNLDNLSLIFIENLNFAYDENNKIISIFNSQSDELTDENSKSLSNFIYDKNDKIIRIENNDMRFYNIIYNHNGLLESYDIINNYDNTRSKIILEYIDKKLPFDFKQTPFSTLDYGISFDLKYNLNYGNTFPKQLKSISYYNFDENNNTWNFYSKTHYNYYSNKNKHLLIMYNRFKKYKIFVTTH